MLLHLLVLLLVQLRQLQLVATATAIATATATAVAAAGGGAAGRRPAARSARGQLRPANVGQLFGLQQAATRWGLASTAQHAPNFC